MEYCSDWSVMTSDEKYHPLFFKPVKSIVDGKEVVNMERYSPKMFPYVCCTIPAELYTESEHSFSLGHGTLRCVDVKFSKNQSHRIRAW